MASAWIEKRPSGRGTRYRVAYRLAGRGPKLYAGHYASLRDARTRRDWVAGELAGKRIPDLRLLEEQAPPTTLREATERWQSSRIDAAPATVLQHRSAVRLVLPLLGDRPVEEIDVADVADYVAELHRAGKARETIRKTVNVLAMILDHAGISSPNPARDRVQVRLPREEREEIAPPSAEHVEAIVRTLAPDLRLPTLVLDATGMRLGELEGLRWGDVDEGLERWRVSRTVEKTRRGRWVPVPPDVFAAVLELRPREDRDPGARVFEGFSGDRLRIALTRACVATGTPTFSPHDLRHRRVSLWHRLGVSWAEIGSWVGQRDLATTANTYTHVLLDDREVDIAVTRDVRG